MKKLKSIKEFSENNGNKKLELKTIYGGKVMAFTATCCEDSYVCSPPCADCSDRDGNPS